MFLFTFMNGHLYIIFWIQAVTEQSYISCSVDLRLRRWKETHFSDKSSGPLQKRNRKVMSHSHFKSNVQSYISYEIFQTKLFMQEKFIVIHQFCEWLLRELYCLENAYYFINFHLHLVTLCFFHDMNKINCASYFLE